MLYYAAFLFVWNKIVTSISHWSKKMYVDCLLYANKYYDLIIIFMRFIIFFY